LRSGVGAVVSLTEGSICGSMRGKRPNRQKCQHFAHLVPSAGHLASLVKYGRSACSSHLVARMLRQFVRQNPVRESNPTLRQTLQTPFIATHLYPLYMHTSVLIVHVYMHTNCTCIRTYIHTGHVYTHANCTCPQKNLLTNLHPFLDILM
jgi:hypothetical protein